MLTIADVRIFFCKYNDPSYVKLEKIDLILSLVCAENVHQVLTELHEYCQEVDVNFARKAMRAVGKCAVNLPESVEACIKLLLDVIENKVHSVLQEAIVVTQNIFRAYPNQYESIITSLCTSLEDIDEPEAKAALIWIIGEYSDRIDAAEEILEYFVETFLEEPSEVQLALLTALSKVYLLVGSDKSADMIQDLLKVTNESVNNPDVRERALIYWRLLASDLEVARDVVLAPKPSISDPLCDEIPPDLVNILEKKIPCVSSVLMKKPSQFVSYPKLYACPKEFIDTGNLDQAYPMQANFDGTSGNGKGNPEGSTDPKPVVDLLGDLLSLDVTPPPPTNAMKPNQPVSTEASQSTNPFDDMW